MRRDQSHAADVAVYDLLDIPRTAREIGMQLRQKLWDAYEMATGEQIVYWEDTWRDGEQWPSPGVRLTALGSATDLLGFPMLNHQQVYGRLVKFEKQGLIGRLSLPSHSRSVLWFRPLTPSAP